MANPYELGTSPHPPAATPSAGAKFGVFILVIAVMAAGAWYYISQRNPGDGTSEPEAEVAAATPAAQPAATGSPLPTTSPTPTASPALPRASRPRGTAPAVPAAITPAAVASPPASTEPGRPTPPSPAPLPGDLVKPDEKPAEPPKDEKWWRARTTAARAALDRDKLLLAALDSRVSALTRDVVNRDDPAQRAALITERLRALEEHDLMRKQVVAATEAIALIEEEARKAGVPPPALSTSISRPPAPEPDPRVYDTATPDVTPPSLLTPIGIAPVRTNYVPGLATIEVIVGSDGSVQSARAGRPPATVGETLEMMNWLSAAKSWRFGAAKKNSQPVKYRLVVPLSALVSGQGIR